MSKRAILLILDGWGEGKPDKFNAIDNAKTPHVNELREKYPNMLLKAHGEFVGLPDGQMGTSEVNHLAIGTGRIVLQDLPKINKSIKDGTFSRLDQLITMKTHVEENGSALHIAGVVSDGGVHSHIDHLFATLDFLKENNFSRPVYIHVFTDGRDTAPKSAIKYMTMLEEKINRDGIGQIATLQGRVYLDRDRDWEKTNQAFQLIRNSEGEKYDTWQNALDDSYKKVDNDQYHKQFYFIEDAKLSDGDAFLFFHFRTDRAFQILKRVLDENIPNLFITGFCNPSEDFDFEPIFRRDGIDNCLAEVLSNNGKTQLHMTETEKFTHLTYFFNGQRETELDKEKWLLFESDRYVKPEYNFEPNMQAFKFTEEIVQSIEGDKYDFIVCNYSNTDMVGHTGNYEAAVIAAESVDFCVGKIYEAIKDRLDDYVLIVTADHGNSDEMWDYESDQPHTQHTLNPVPFIVITDGEVKLEGTDLLQNIAPTILEFMEIDKPDDMEGESLLN